MHLDSTAKEVSVHLDSTVMEVMTASKEYDDSNNENNSNQTLTSFRRITTQPLDDSQSRDEPSNE